MRTRLAIVAAMLLLLLPGIAQGAREPTNAERAVITDALDPSYPPSLNNGEHCFRVRVSTVSVGWAAEEFHGGSMACQEWSSHGVVVLRAHPINRCPGGIFAPVVGPPCTYAELWTWKVVFSEFRAIPCRQGNAPSAVKRDLAIPGCGYRRGGVKPGYW